MSLPLLQLALDNKSLAEAFQSTRLLAPEIDIIEVGTILACADGMQAVRCMKAAYPDRIVLADVKAADAGSILSNMCFDNGADWMTVICCAPIATVESAMKEAQKRGGKYDVQIELTGSWTWEEAKNWHKVGIRQVVYHRGRDAQAAGQSWAKEDIDTISRLAEMGFHPSITGGLVIDDLQLFKGLPVKSFISGRSMREAPDPAAEARAFKARIAELWG